MESFLLGILNGLTMGMLLFLAAVGFSITFGLMNVVNLAHGSFFMIGAYVGCTVSSYTNNFIIAVIAGGCAAGILGIVTRWSVLEHYAKDSLAQLLLTIGLLFIVADAALWIWGGNPYSLTNKPWGFKGSIQIGFISFPAYRLLVIIAGSVVAFLLWLFQERTKYGAIVRAGVDDEEIVRGIGINIPLVMTLVFGLGTFLAGIGGVIGGPIMGAYPGLDLNVLIHAMAVVIIGGIGNLRGTLVGALFVGLADNFGKIYFPAFNYSFLFALVAILLVVRPTGLWGEK
jgi:branched-chain amino acid transport system permease protein